MIPSPDDPHIDKNIVAEHDNYWQIKNGDFSVTKIIQVSVVVTAASNVRYGEEGNKRKRLTESRLEG